MSSTKLTCKVFRLKGIRDLEEVKTKIFKRNYTSNLKVARNDEKLFVQLPENEKTFNYEWFEKSNICNLSIPKYNDDDKSNCEETVRFVYATAKIEYSKIKKKTSNGEFLPKYLRTNTVNITTYFILIGGCIFIIICTSNALFQERVKKLIGINNVQEVDKDFYLSSDLFNWMFYQFLEKKGNLESGLRIESIDGFIGNSIDEHNVFKGTSDQTSELIITKAFISNGEILNTISARIQNKDIDIAFTMDNECNTQIYTNLSKKLRIMDSEKENIFFVVYLYSYLIPKLKEIYKNASIEFLNIEGKEFSAKIGLEVIKSIIKFNAISLKNIENIYASISSEETPDKSSTIMV